MNTDIRTLLSAAQSEEALPANVTVDEYFRTWIESLWQASVTPSCGLLPFEPGVHPFANAPIASVREHGAALGLVGNVLSLWPPRSGTSKSFRILTSEMNVPGFIGYVHTHPYADGAVGMAFSDRDFAAILKNPAVFVLLVISGESAFMLVRTSQTWTDVPEMDIFKFYRGCERHFTAAWNHRKQAGIFNANLLAARRYKLGFYLGSLRRSLLRLQLFQDV
jgi:hypothetical protein